MYSLHQLNQFAHGLGNRTNDQYGDQNRQYGRDGRTRQHRSDRGDVLLLDDGPQGILVVLGGEFDLLGDVRDRPIQRVHLLSDQRVTLFNYEYDLVEGFEVRLPGGDEIPQ